LEAENGLIAVSIIHFLAKCLQDPNQEIATNYIDSQSQAAKYPKTITI
jgi:hypothetical protein